MRPSLDAVEMHFHGQNSRCRASQGGILKELSKLVSKIFTTKHQKCQKPPALIQEEETTDLTLQSKELKLNRRYNPSFFF
jgi:hypothetical protein